MSKCYRHSDFEESVNLCSLRRNPTIGGTPSEIGRKKRKGTLVKKKKGQNVLRKDIPH
jgi:hypothetical protein